MMIFFLLNFVCWFASFSYPILRITMITEVVPKLANQYSCEFCGYVSNRSNDLKKHFLTGKHLERVKQDNNGSSGICDFSHNKFSCKCGKKYLYASGLSKHKKTCQSIKKQNITNTTNTTNNTTLVSENQIASPDIKLTTEMIFELIKSNQEFQKDMITAMTEGFKKVMTTTTINNINNIGNINTTNNTFNLQVFLNEKCKDALNVNEFIENVQLGLDDLEYTGREGYVKGLTNVFYKNLKQLDLYHRPFHCTDVKREVIYIKDENKWEKDDDEKAKLTNMIKNVANKNFKQISEWIKENPKCMNTESKENDKYLQIISNSMSGSTTEESESNVKNIIKNIAKEITIDKDKIN